MKSLKWLYIIINRLYYFLVIFVYNYFFLLFLIQNNSLTYIMGKKYLIGRIIKKKNSTFYFLTSLLKPFINDSHYLLASYTYLRYLDDKIDNPSTSISEAKFLVATVRNKINHFMTHNDFIIEANIDLLLKDFLFYAQSHKPTLIVNFLNILDSFEFDIARIGKLISKDELDNYSFQMGGSFINFISHFLEIPEQKIIPISNIASLSCQAYMLKDYFEDIERGYINIPKEDISSFNLDISNVLSDNFSIWVSREIKRLNKNIVFYANIDITELKFTTKLILYLFLVPRIYFIKVIRRNKFVLIKNYKFSLSDYIHMTRMVIRLRINPSLKAVSKNLLP